MIATDLLAFAQTLLLHDTGLARAEPKALRYRLLPVAARLARGQRTSRTIAVGSRKSRGRRCDSCDQGA
jgi:hypothetical protein